MKLDVMKVTMCLFVYQYRLTGYSYELLITLAHVLTTRCITTRTICIHKLHSKAMEDSCIPSYFKTIFWKCLHEFMITSYLDLRSSENSVFRVYRLSPQQSQHWFLEIMLKFITEKCHMIYLY